MFNRKTDQEKNQVVSTSVNEPASVSDTTKRDDKQIDLAQQAAANLAGWQKALADYQNLQKDTEKRLAQLRDFVKIDLIQELLPIFDSYQKALAHVPDSRKNESWLIGLQHTLKLWETFLADQGIKKIETMGKHFDTRWHESIGMVQEPDQLDQVIVEEKQAGYVLNDMVIRPAKVIINNISK